MSTSQKTNGQTPVPHVWEIYSHLYNLYRRGDFEQELKCYQYEWPELDNNADFYDYQAPKNDIEFTEKTITYTEAIENLYQLVLFLEQHRESWVKEHQVECLTIKNLIFEVKDYTLTVPSQLGQFFLNQAKEFNELVKRNEVGHYALELRRQTNARRDLDDDHAQDIKAQIVAALWGTSFLYRSHMPENYELALEIVGNIEMYVKRELPRQDRYERASYGLIGLTMYLKGKLLSATGDYLAAQKAYAQSSDAYVARLEQKNGFYKKDYISKEQYEAKKMVTLRRAALVSALGVGYLAFISSRISKALAALRVSRAVLKQNVGTVFEAYTDVLFFACRRAEGSSERHTVEEVIQGLEACRDTLSNLVPDTHYLHRAGIELAIALHYRAKFEQQTGAGTERALADHEQAMKLLEAAINHSEAVEGGYYKNQWLLTEALFIRSYIRRCLPEITVQNKHSYLSKAEEDARRARTVATGNSRMECESLIALGSVQYEQSRYYKSNNKEDDFHRKLNAAQRSFREALMLNDGKNVRIEAVCYLKLTKLSLFDPSSVALAHDYFKKWKEIENRVEHAFCHYMAQEINERLSQGGPLLIINAEFSLNYAEWKKTLFMHLINTMLIKLSEETRKHQYDEDKLYGLIADALMKKLKFKKTTAYGLIDKHRLVEQLQQRNK